MSIYDLTVFLELRRVPREREAELASKLLHPIPAADILSSADQNVILALRRMDGMFSVQRNDVCVVGRAANDLTFEQITALRLE